MPAQVPVIFTPSFLHGRTPRPRTEFRAKEAIGNSADPCITRPTRIYLVSLHA